MKMSILEAEKVLEKIDPSKRVIDDNGQIKTALKVLALAKAEEILKIQAGTLSSPTDSHFFTPLEVQAIKEVSQNQIKQINEVAKTSFHQEGFNWKDPKNWQDVTFQNTSGCILFSHRISLKGLSSEQENEIRTGLKKYGIFFKEREATHSKGNIQAGERTLRIADAESIKKLRGFIFRWPSITQHSPVSMTQAEYNKFILRQKNRGR